MSVTVDGRVWIHPAMLADLLQLPAGYRVVGAKFGTPAGCAAVAIDVAFDDQPTEAKTPLHLLMRYRCADDGKAGHHAPTELTKLVLA